MKWTKPQSLESAYGVSLVGWPPDVPMRNPSHNSIDTNRTLLEGLRSHTIHFTRVLEPQLQASNRSVVDQQQSSHFQASQVSGSAFHSQGEKRKRAESNTGDT